MRKSKIIYLLLFGLGLTRVQAQESVNSSARNATSNNGTVNYSIGQVFYQSEANTNGTKVQPGIQFAYEVFVLTDINASKKVNISVIAYPNPTTDVLNLEVGNNENLNNLNFTIYDSNGKFILGNNIRDTKTTIPLQNILSDVYILKIFENKKEIKSFKIIKK